MDLQTLHIINDKDNIHRRSRLMDELKKQRIENYFLWDAVHDPRGTYQGINRAHKQIVKWAKENELPYVTIAEDDVMFFDKGAYNYYLDNEPKEYDIYLAGIFLGEINQDNKVSSFTGMSLYKCHNNFYNTFLNANENEHIDISLANKGIYKVCNPMVVRQHNGFSTNENRWMNYDFMFDHRQVFKSG